MDQAPAQPVLAMSVFLRFEGIEKKLSIDLRDRESRSFELYCAAPIDRDRISILDSGKRKFPGRDFGRREPRIAGFSEKNELADQIHYAEAAEIVKYFNIAETSGNPQD